MVRRFFRLTISEQSERIDLSIPLWACSAVGSALPWHGRGRRFDPDQVHHPIFPPNPLESALVPHILNPSAVGQPNHVLGLCMPIVASMPALAKEYYRFSRLRLLLPGKYWAGWCRRSWWMGTRPPRTCNPACQSLYPHRWAQPFARNFQSNLQATN